MPSVSDMAIMVRSMAGDAASKAADKLQPTEDQMSQIDAPAEDNTWHEPPKKPDMSPQKIKEQLKNIRGRASSARQNDGTLEDTAVAVKDEAGLNADQDPGAQVSETQKDAKNKLKEFQSRGQDYLGRKMPKERREQTIWRLKKMIVEIQGHADCMLPLLRRLKLTSRRPRSSRHLVASGRRVRWSW
jgi:hypothetical protein